MRGTRAPQQCASEGRGGGSRGRRGGRGEGSCIIGFSRGVLDKKVLRTPNKRFFAHSRIGKSFTAKALIDSGSTNSLIKKKFVDDLQIPTTTRRKNIIHDAAGR